MWCGHPGCPMFRRGAAILAAGHRGLCSQDGRTTSSGEFSALHRSAIRCNLGEMTTRAPHPSEWSWLAALFGAWLVWMIASVALCGDGFIHPEAYSFLPHYLSGRRLVDLVLDNRVTDWGLYQARELGFVFDFLDAQFFAWCRDRGFLHFFSASHYLFLLGAGLILWTIAVRHLHLGRGLAVGLVLLLWTSPSATLHTSLYRISKVGLLFAVFLAAWLWLGASRAEGKVASVMLFGAASLMWPMFDKQGLIFLCGAVAFLSAQFMASRSRADLRLLAAGLASFLGAWIYQKWLGPGLIAAVQGYEIGRGYASDQ